MFKFGVIDPAKVVRTALQDAASVAGLLITTEAMIADKPEPKGQAGGGMRRRHGRHGRHGRHDVIFRPSGKLRNGGLAPPVLVSGRRARPGTRRRSPDAGEPREADRRRRTGAGAARLPVRRLESA